MVPLEVDTERKLVLLTMGNFQGTVYAQHIAGDVFRKGVYTAPAFHKNI